MRVGETDKVAIKTAYGRYVGVSTSGELAGRTEAMGPREQWQLVFEEVRSVYCAQIVTVACCRARWDCVPATIAS